MNTAAARPTPPTDAELAMLAELGARHGLWTTDAEPATLARGTENTTFSVGDHIVRLAEDRDAAAREVALLDALAATAPAPIPKPLVHDPDGGLVVYRRLPGSALIHHRRRRGALIADALIPTLAAVHQLAITRELPLDDYPNDAWHDDAVRHFRAAHSHLEPAWAAVIASFLSDSPPSDRRRVEAQHNDLGAEHILVDQAGVVTGIIDWTDAARTDPARDLGLVYRDIGSKTALRIAAALDGPVSDDERARIRFHARCKWLEDFHYAVEHPEAGAYLSNCLLTFEHTFAGFA